MEEFEKLMGSLCRLSESLTNPTEMTENQLSEIMDKAIGIKTWIESVRGEIVARINDGLNVEGYDVRVKSNRFFADIPGAINAIRAYDCEAAEKCTFTSLKNLSEVKAILGSDVFEDVVGEFLGEKPSKSLVKTKR